MANVLSPMLLHCSVILDSRTSRQMSPAGLTPCQPQTWRRHDYRAHSNSGVQRQLRFTPTEHSDQLPPLTPHRNLDNAPMVCWVCDFRTA